MYVTAKKLCTIEECKYCPYFEEIRITEIAKNNPLVVGAEFYKCNKLKICVEANKTYLPHPKEHLFTFCPLEEVIE